MLATLPAIAPCRLRHFAPRHGAHIHKSISDTRAFGLAVKAGGANVPPAIEHDGSPSLLRLYLERQLERCGLEVEVDARRIQEALERDPLHDGGPKRG